MSSPEQTRKLVESLHSVNVERERLLELIGALAAQIDRDMVIDIAHSVLSSEPVQSGGCVLFGDIAFRVGADGRIDRVFRTDDGKNPVPATVIVAESRTRGDT